MLRVELFVFIRSLPQFAGTIFEELERIEPFVEVVELSEGSSMDREGWSLIFRGRLETSGRIVEREDMVFHSSAIPGRIVDPAVLIFFSKNSMDRFLRAEPEIALPVAEYMKRLREQAENS